MKIYIVALNEGEWANVACLCEVTAIAKRTWEDCFYKREQAL